MYASSARQTFSVVLAKARTHYPNCRLSRDAGGRFPVHKQIRLRQDDGGDIAPVHYPLSIGRDSSFAHSPIEPS
ncbi:hypothetical protein ACVIHF_007401 [Bradyrhizobium sp. USDA 4506]